MRAPISYDQLKSRVLRLKTQNLGPTEPDFKADWDALFDRTLLDPCIAGFALLDREFVLRRSNGIYAKILRENAKFDISQAIGKCYFDVTPRTSSNERAFIHQVLETNIGRAFYNLKMETSNKGRHATYWNEHVSPLIDEDGEPVGCVVCLVTATRAGVSKEIRETSRLLNSGDFAASSIREQLVTVAGLLENYTRDVQQRLLGNVCKELTYFVDCLKATPLNDEQKACISGIDMFLRNALPAPSHRDGGAISFSGSRTGGQTDGAAPSYLTAAEARVAHWVCRGRSSKEIASILGVSKRCVDFHRRNIRKKLDLAERNINLGGYLRSLQS